MRQTAWEKSEERGGPSEEHRVSAWLAVLMEGLSEGPICQFSSPSVRTQAGREEGDPFAVY